MSHRGLRGVPTAELHRLLHLLADQPPEQLFGPGTLHIDNFPHLLDEAPLLRDLPIAAVRAVLTTAIAEREALKHSPHELVWTGPDDSLPHQARSTRLLLTELFGMARKEVLVAGCSFNHGQEVLQPLADSMAAHGLKVKLYFDVDQVRERLRGDAYAQDLYWRVPRERLLAAESQSPAALTALVKELFLDIIWPKGAPKPELVVDQRTAGKQGVSFHAKCVVVDRRHVLITSANFTSRAQHRNYELGVLMDDPEFAAKVVIALNEVGA